ncbi:MAG: hypothetical protein WD273_04000 [Trueperaceae bacterium]
MRKPRRSRNIGVTCALLLLIVAGCRPLYLPPVPAPPELPERLEVDASAGLDDQRPRIRVELRNVPAEGWLAVQWFAPNNREVASESVWIAPEDEGRVVELNLPQDVEAVPGRWRAVVSLTGEVIRQLSVEIL